MYLFMPPSWIASIRDSTHFSPKLRIVVKCKARIIVQDLGAGKKDLLNGFIGFRGPGSTTLRLLSVFSVIRIL